MRKAFKALALLCVLAAGFSFSASQENPGGKNFIVGFSFNPMISQTSLGGKGTSDARAFLQETMKDIEKKYGYQAALKIYPSPKFLLKALQDGSAQFAGTYLAIYLYARTTGVPVKPFMAVSSTGKKTERVCIYARKSAGYKKVSDLRNKTFVAEYPMYLSKKEALPPEEGYLWWVLTKKILEKGGVKKPLKEFFKDYKVLAIPAESVAYSVLFKKFDAILLVERDRNVMQNYDKEFAQLVPVDCITVPANAPFVYSLKGSAPEMLNIMRESHLSKINFKKDSGLV